MKALIPPSRRRLLVMPVLILMIGCAVAWWSSARNARDREEVWQAVWQTVREACGGNASAVPTDPSSPMLRELLVEELRKACAQAGSADALDVHVNAGDTAGVGGQSMIATHTAVVRLKSSGKVLLALRAQRAEGGGVLIVGYSVAAGE